MVAREIVVLASAYNLTRTLINRAVKDQDGIIYERVSFANSLAQIRHFSPKFRDDLSLNELRKLMNDFNRMLTDTLVIYRPNRSEQRAIKSGIININC